MPDASALVQTIAPALWVTNNDRFCLDGTAAPATGPTAGGTAHHRAFSGNMFHLMLGNNAGAAAGRGVGVGNPQH